MPITSRWGQQNPLIRRVQQHGALTTLFRTPKSTASSSVHPLVPPPLVLGQMTPVAPMAAGEPAVDLETPMVAPVAEAEMAAWTADHDVLLGETSSQNRLTDRLTEPSPALVLPPMAPRADVAAPGALQPPAPVQRTPSAQPLITIAPPAPSLSSIVQPSVQPPTPPLLAPALPVGAPAGRVAPMASPASVTAVMPPSQPVAAMPSPQPGLITSPGPVQRQLVAPAMPVTSPAVTGQSIAAATSATSLPQPALSALPSSPPLSALPSSPPLSAPPTNPPPPVQRQAAPTSAPTPGDGIDDRTWSRLQSAFHKAKAQARESSVAPLPSTTPAAPVTRPPIAPAVTQRQPDRTPLRRTTISEQRTGQPFPATPTPDRPPVAATPMVDRADLTAAPPDDGAASSIVQRSATPPDVGERAAAVATTSLPASAVAQSVATRLQQPPTAAELADPSPLPVSPTETPSPSLPATSAGALPPAPTADAIPTVRRENATVAVVQRASASLLTSATPALPPSAPSAPRLDEMEGALTAEWATTAQPDPTPEPTLSLETVWPVQRLSAPTAFVDTPAPSASAPTTFVTPVAAPPALTDTVRQQLETTHTARRTDSKVDILMPRRPRPVLRSSEPPLETVVDSTALQRQSDEATQAEPAANEQQLAVTQPALVPTEIGPLPADLWRLIGAQPPAPAPTVTTSAPVNTKTQVTPAVSQPLGSAAAPAVQRAPVTQTPLSAADHVPAAAPIDLPAPALHAEPTGGGAVPGQVSLPTGQETIATSMAAPAAYTPAVTIPTTVTPPFADGIDTVDQGSSPVIPAVAPGTPGSSPVPVATDALQLQPITTAQPVSALANEKRPSAPPVLVTQQAPPSVLRQVDPAAPPPVTTASTPAATGKKKRRKRSTPTK